ncbi:MAG: hypothetical protein GY803_23315 [Chloroflexi bacterium]|nr:hypothetical protein [Chloroflexota bacterium]
MFHKYLQTIPIMGTLTAVSALYYQQIVLALYWAKMGKLFEIDINGSHVFIQEHVMQNLKTARPLFPVVFLLVLLTMAAACAPSAAEPTVELIVPTALAPEPGAAQPTVAPMPTVELPPPPTIPPSEMSGQPTPQPTEQPAALPPATPQYQVAFVEADDTLNVRSGPGVNNGVVAELAPNAGGALITGPGQLVSGSTWVPIAADGVTGWVNGRYLTQTVSDAAFCQDDAVMALVETLKTAVANQDGALLAQHIHPERGLRIRHAWWNPEIKINQAEARHIFASSTNYDWGVQDGSGNPIVGSFAQEILPMLQEDLAPATEVGCNEILHGGTAGYVRLPEGYEQVRVMALHHPGTEEFAGMDWGTWAVGIEQWQGKYYLSFLVHFAWEI